MKKTDIILKNEQSLVLKIATITTNMLAKYIYEGIKNLIVRVWLNMKT